MAIGRPITLPVVTIESPKNNEVVLGQNMPLIGTAHCTRETTDIDRNTTTEDITHLITKVEVKFGPGAYQLATKTGPSSTPWSQWTFTGPMPSSVTLLTIAAKVTVGRVIDEASVTVRVGIDLPIALLPVRLETRFVREGGTDLLIRVYPDDLHVDTYEPELTGDEVTWGQHFWGQTWRAGSNEAQKPSEQAKRAWAQLAQRFGPERAAWIARVLAPKNPNDRPRAPVPEGQALSPPPQFREVARRADSWTRAPHTRVLPDRWVAIGYRGTATVFTATGNPIPDPLPRSSSACGRTALPGAIPSSKPMSVPSDPAGSLPFSPWPLPRASVPRSIGACLALSRWGKRSAA